MVEFCLNHEQSNNIDEWIRFAIARGVEKIDLLLYDRYFRHPHYNNLSYKFPFGLSFECDNSPTLKHMHLTYCLLIHHPISFNIRPFTNLRSLEVVNSGVDVNLLTTLLSNCLLFEELSLLHCDLSSSTLEIVSFSLCHFKLKECSHHNVNGDLEFILLDCPKLTSFYYDQNGLKATLSMDTPILKTIYYFDFLYPETLDEDLAFFATLPKLESLNLRIDYSSLRYDDEEELHMPLQSIQKLENLRELNLIVDTILYGPNDFEIWWILAMLKASPLLQKLSVMIIRPKFYEDQRDIQDNILFAHDEIKVIELRGCVGNSYESEFTRNALKYIHNLERIVLSPHWTDDRFNQEGCDPTWSRKGREIILEKLQAEGIELDKLVLE